MGCGMRNEVYCEQLDSLATAKSSGYKTPVHTEIFAKWQKTN